MVTSRLACPSTVIETGTAAPLGEFAGMDALLI